MDPVILSSVRPGGREPLAIDQSYGGVPPLAWSVREYGVLNLPVGSDAVVIVKGTACTVRAVVPLTAPSVAVMVLWPAATPVARPAVIVAMAVFEDAHVTWVVKFCVLPSL